jgi:hypothetical protein
VRARRIAAGGLSLLSLALLFAATSRCSLLAPSDAELMGGVHPDGATRDATADGDSSPAPDASPRPDACLPAGFSCNGDPTVCCTGTCMAAGGHKCD